MMLPLVPKKYYDYYVSVMLLIAVKAMRLLFTSWLAYWDVWSFLILIFCIQIGLSITMLLGYSVILLMVSDITPASGGSIPLLSKLCSS